MQALLKQSLLSSGGGEEDGDVGTEDISLQKKKKIEHLTERYGKEAAGRKTDVSIVTAWTVTATDDLRSEDDASEDVRDREITKQMRRRKSSYERITHYGDQETRDGREGGGETVIQ